MQPDALSSTGEVKISPSGKFIFPEHGTQVLPAVENVISVFSPTILIFEVLFKILEKLAEEAVTYDDLLEEETENESTAPVEEKATPTVEKKEEKVEADTEQEEVPTVSTDPITIYVMVNGSPVKMSGKPKYVFVDVFNYINFDLSKSQGAIVTTVNGHDANYMEELHDKDIIEIYWRKF